jgi:hypothetical protein
LDCDTCSLRAIGKLGSLCDFAGFDAVGADFFALRATLRQLDPNRLQIRIKPSGCTIIRVRYVITELWTFPTNFAAFGHYFNETSEGNQPKFSASTYTVL